MILVDIQVPMLDGIYDFELDEEQKVAVLMGKVLTILAQKENVQVEKGEEMYLYALGQENILDKKLSLRQQGVGSGDRLILI